MIQFGQVSSNLNQLDPIWSNLIQFDPIWSNFNLTILGEADKEFQAIIALIHEVEGFAKQYNVPGANINPYTNLTGAVSFFSLLCFHDFFVKVQIF